MKFIFVDESWEDYLYWQKTDQKKLKRINELLKDISRTPFQGIGFQCLEKVSGKYLLAIR